MTPAGVTLAVEFDVYNPNGFPLVAHSVDGSLDLGEGAAVGEAHATPASPIPARGSSIVSSTMNVIVVNLAGLAPLALSGRPVRYTFRGTAKIGGERLNVSLPLELKGELGQAQLLQAGLRGLTP